MTGLHHMQTRHLWSAVHLLHHPVALALRVVDVGEHVLNAPPRAGKCPYSGGAFATPVCRHNGLHAKMCNTVGNDGSCDTWMLRLCPHPSRQKVLTPYIGCTYARVDHAVDGVEDGNLVSQWHAWPGVTV